VEKEQCMNEGSITRKKTRDEKREARRPSVRERDTVTRRGSKTLSKCTSMQQKADSRYQMANKRQHRHEVARPCPSA
jgi:hypothetical protein